MYDWYVLNPKNTGGQRYLWWWWAAAALYCW